MRRTVFVFAVATIVALGASQAQAKTIQASETIKGKVTISAGGGPGGACTDGYSNQCPHPFSAASCTCAHFADGTITGGLGKGTVVLDVTIDESDDIENNLEHGCRPIFGEADVTIMDPKTRTGSVGVNVNGTVCDSLTKDGPQLIEGGFALINCFSPTGEKATTASGYGVVAGTVDSSGNVVLKLKGPITAPGESCS